MFLNVFRIGVLSIIVATSTSVFAQRQLRDVVGVGHLSGHYSFSSWPVPNDGVSKRDYLNEGAQEILDVGSRVIKVILHPGPKAWYHYTANPPYPQVFGYPAENRLVEAAKGPQFAALFAKPFTTYVIYTMANLRHVNADGSEDVTRFGFYDQILDGLSAAERNTEKQAVKNLATYLLQTYRNTGKTFVIVNVEGDQYLGEYGSAENGGNLGNSDQQAELIRRMTEAAIAWGCRYVIYWQVYCNEPCQDSQWPCERSQAVIDSYDTRPTNNQMRGMWLVRPDRSRPPVYEYFRSLMSQSILQVSLRTSLGYFVMAQDAGGGPIYVNAPHMKEWEFLTIVDRNGGNLLTNDPINILTQNGHYFMAWNNGGSSVEALTTQALVWEQFTILKQNGTGPVVNGDVIAIRAGSGHYFVAEGGGGGSNVLNANRTAIGPWEQFGVIVH